MVTVLLGFAFAGALVYAVVSTIRERGPRFSKLSSEEQERRNEAGQLLRGESITEPDPPDPASRR